MRLADDISGYEFDWLAADADGHIGFFSTAGGGFAPEEFLREVDAHDRAIDAILARDATCGATRNEPFAGAVDTWKMMAERGIYAFDSDPSGGPYRLTAWPAFPVRIVELPDVAAAVVRRLTFDHLRFAELVSIDADGFHQRAGIAERGPAR